MSGPAFSGGFMRAITGQFSDGVRAREKPPESQIHTDVYDHDRDKLPLLEPLTANEMKLFKRGGFQAVIEDRRFYAREKGDPTWNEIGTKRYGIQKTPPGAIPTWLRQPEKEGQGETETPGSLPVSARGLPEADRPTVGAQGTGQGPSRGRVQADEQDEPRDGQAEDGTQRLRARTRPGAMVGRSENRTARPIAKGSASVQVVREKNPPGVGKADEGAVPASTRGVKRTRRKYEDTAARMRAYRARKKRGR